MSQSAWAQSWPKMRGSVEPYTGLTPLHSCTFFPLLSDLSCAHDHSSNAFALAQVVPQNRVAFDTGSRCVLHVSSRNGHLDPTVARSCDSGLEGHATCDPPRSGDCVPRWGELPGHWQRSHKCHNATRWSPMKHHTSIPTLRI